MAGARHHLDVRADDVLDAARASRAQPVLKEMYALADDVLEAAFAGLTEEDARRLEQSLLHVKSNLAGLLNGNGDGRARKAPTAARP